MSESWDHIASLQPDVRSEEIVLRNTFFNSKLEDQDKSLLDPEKKKSKLKKKKQSPLPDKKRKRIKWVDESTKVRTVETEVYGPTAKGLKLHFDLGLPAPKSILKGSLKKQEKAYSQEHRRTDWRSDSKQQDLLSNHRGEVASLKNEPIASTRKKEVAAFQPQRPKSSSYHNDVSSEDSEIDSVVKGTSDLKVPNRRLLYTGDKTIEVELGNKLKSPVSLALSNSFKRLDSGKSKRGETPRRREPSEKDKRKTSEITVKAKEDLGLQPNYVKPPAAKKVIEASKKTTMDTAIEKLRRENNYLFKHDSHMGDSGLRDNSDYQNSAKKKINKSDIEEKDHLNGNLSKNR